MMRIVALLALKLPIFALVFCTLMATAVLSQSAPDHTGPASSPPDKCEALTATQKIASHMKSRGGSVSRLSGAELRALKRVHDALHPNAVVRADMAVAISPSYDIRLMSGFIRAGSWEIRFFEGDCLSKRWNVSGQIYDRINELIHNQNAEAEADPTRFERAMALLTRAIADEAIIARATDRPDVSTSEESTIQESPVTPAEIANGEPSKESELELPSEATAKETDYCTLGGWPEDIESVNLTPKNRKCAEENTAREERMRNGTETVEDWRIWGAQRKAREIDIRKCPLDTTVFIDPWVDGSFSVKRVGEHWIYLCDSGVVEEPPDSEFCRGPWGKLVLVGDVKKSRGDSVKEIVAVYYIDDASPCCGWRIYEDGSDVFDDVRWLEPEDVPLLGDLPFASIEETQWPDSASRKGSILGNEKIAMMCTLHEGSR